MNLPASEGQGWVWKQSVLFFFVATAAHQVWNDIKEEESLRRMDWFLCLFHHSGKKYWYILCLFLFSSSFSSLQN